MKVLFSKNEDGTINTHKDHNNRAPGLLRVFVSDHRVKGEARPGMGDLAADFAWRRSVKMTDVKKDPTFRKVIAEYLQRPEAELVYRFNRHCGCAMCPCSPGILIQDGKSTYQSASVYDVWVDIFTDDQDPETILAAEKAALELKRAEYAAQKLADEAKKIAEAAQAVPIPIVEGVAP
jgi:hypothetical protein